MIFHQVIFVVFDGGIQSFLEGYVPAVSPIAVVRIDLIEIKNVAREAYIEWYADKSNFSSYYKIGEGKEAMFAIKLIAV